MLDWDELFCFTCQWRFMMDELTAGHSLCWTCFFFFFPYCGWVESIYTTNVLRALWGNPCSVGCQSFLSAAIIRHHEKVEGDWGYKAAAWGLTRGPPVCWLERLYKAAHFFFFFFGTADHVSVNRSDLWSSRESAQLGNLYCDLIFAFTAGKAWGAMSSKSQQYKWANHVQTYNTVYVFTVCSHYLLCPWRPQVGNIKKYIYFMYVLC